MSLIVGGSLAAVTVSTKVSVAASVPSLTVSVIVAVPLWFAAGVTVTVRAAPLPPMTRFASGTSVWLAEVAVTVRLAAGVSTSPTVKARAPGRRVLGDGLIGDVADRRRVVDGRDGQRRTCRVAVSVPSLTVRVIVAVPLWFAAGVTVTVRLGAAAAEDDVGVGHQRLVRGGRRDRQAGRRRLDVADGDGQGAGRRVLRRRSDRPRR